MKKRLLSGLLCLGLSLFAAESSKPEVRQLKILTIGNSFSNSVFQDLKNIVRNESGCAITLNRASLGGCTFSRHWDLHLKSEKDPSFKPYKPFREKYSLRDLLTSDKWDIVTIQQGSHKSWVPDSFHPDADNLIKLIRTLAPQAEIVIQQTWSYNSAAPRLKEWKIDQNQMYERLTENYRELARKYGLRMIPVGYAVQLYRKDLGKELIQLDPAEFKSFKKPARPKNNDVVANFSWQKNPKTGKDFLRFDASHMNPAGRYLQACVWFAFLYGKDPETIKYIPAGMSRERAAYFRKLAKRAIEGFPQVEKNKINDNRN